MTTPAAHNQKQNPADHNRMVRLTTIRTWDRLLAEATKPNAKGIVAIEISHKDGRLGEPKITTVKYGCDE
jgi:hypothetical protein